tara:strand:+ start:101 stop:376 length:276 start_codon:yes stop_codon:yes gene_type:complete
MYKWVLSSKILKSDIINGNFIEKAIIIAIIILNKRVICLKKNDILIGNINITKKDTNNKIKVKLLTKLLLLARKNNRKANRTLILIKEIFL